MRMTKKVVSLVLAILMVTTMMSVMAVTTAFAADYEIALSGSDSITIDVGGSYKITGSTTAAKAVIINTDEAVTIVDSDFEMTTATAGNSAISIDTIPANVTILNSTIKSKIRGINMTVESTSTTDKVTLNIVNSNIYNTSVSNLDTQSYTAKDSRGINMLNSSYDVTMTGSEMKGFKYSINETTATTKLAHTVTVSESKIYGWAILNSYSKGGTYAFTDCELKTINKTSQSSWNNFAAFVFASACEDNSLTIDNCTVDAIFGEGDDNGNPHQSLFISDGKNCDVVIKGADTEVNIDRSRGGFVTYSNTRGDNDNSVTIQGGTFNCDIISYPVTELNIDDGTFNGVVYALNDVDISGGTFNDVVASYLPEQFNSSLTITGGTFNDYVTSTTDDAAAANITITGGTFAEDASAYVDTEAGVQAVEDGGKTYVVPAGTVAVVGSTPYDTLQEAIAAAGKDDTITLLADIETASNTSISKNITLDLNGKKITCTGDDAVVVTSGKTLNLVNSASDTGYIYTTNANATCYGIFNVGGTVNVGTGVQIGSDIAGTGGIYCKGGVVNVNGGTVIGNGASYAAIVVAKQGAVATVNSGLVQGIDTFAISGNGSTGQEGYTINVNGGTVKSNTTAIYHPNSGALNISDGTVEGSTGVYVKAGTTTVTGGTITATGSAQAYSFNGNGANGTGDAICVDSCNYPGGVPTVDIQGGTFESENADAVGSYKKSDDENYSTDTSPAVESFISGGTFSSDVDVYAAPGMVGEKKADGSYGVVVDTNPLNDKVEIEGYEKKITSVLEGNDIGTQGVRIMTKVDNSFLTDESVTDYGYVVAKYTGSKTQAQLDFSKLTTAADNGQKKISCKGSANTVKGSDYVTLAVNGMTSTNKVVARFYVVKNGVTYYSYYISTARYNGILAAY